MAERLPEIMLERHRLKAEGVGLKEEKTSASKERLKSIARRLNYVRARTVSLRDEHATLTAERGEISQQLKSLKLQAAPTAVEATSKPRRKR